MKLTDKQKNHCLYIDNQTSIFNNFKLTKILLKNTNINLEIKNKINDTAKSRKKDNIAIIAFKIELS